MFAIAGRWGMVTTVLSACVVAACAEAVPAKVETISCLSSVTSQQTMPNPPTAWQVVAATTPHQLVSVTLFDGPVEEKASLVYDEQSETATDRTAIWKLDANPRGYWLSCGYDRTSLVLTRKLPSEISRCQVVYEKATTLSGLPTIKTMSCK